MGWFRSNLRSGAGWALFALLLQFVLAFGHVHTVVYAKLTGAVAQQSASISHAPADDGAPGDDWRDCAVCRLTQIAGQGLTSAPPSLSKPIGVGTTIAPTVLADHLTAARPLPFNARGPPTA
jgi:hypothetical protein